MQKEVIIVKGMTCEHCIQKIKKFVGEVDGVSQVDVDLSAQKVFVDFNPPAHLEQLKEAIYDAGFEIA